MVPFAEKSPMVTSCIRIGTPAMTTRGMKEPEMIRIADLIHKALSGADDAALGQVRSAVQELCSSFPLYAALQHD